jgi:hypothetical protein
VHPYVYPVPVQSHQDQGQDHSHQVLAIQQPSASEVQRREAPEKTHATKSNGKEAKPKNKHREANLDFCRSLYERLNKVDAKQAEMVRGRIIRLVNNFEESAAENDE